MAILNLFLSLLLVSHVILSMPSPSVAACLLPCESETNLLLYLQQIYSGPGKNLIFTFASPKRNQFGTTAIMDWAVLDSPQPNKASILARAQGMYFQGDVAGTTWVSYFSIVFQGGRFRGSSFQVMGLIYENGGQMAIIGGTGELAMARGVVNYKTLSRIPNYQIIKELRIHIIYAPPTGSIAGAAIL